MQQCLLNVISGLTLAVLLGCNMSPAAPSSSSPPASPFPFAHLLGNYALTIQVDEHCADIPQSERLRAYDAVLRDTPFQYMSVSTLGGGPGGELWFRPDLVSGDSRFQFRWNEDADGTIGACDGPEPLIDSAQFYLCGTGAATLRDESIIDGALVGLVYIRGRGPELRCTGSHQFRFVRQTR